MSLDIEGVLRDHGALGYDDCDGCECGADVRTHEAHRAHVAAVLREQIEAALAEAWEDGHDCCTYPICRANPYRAAHLSDAERAGGAE